MPRRKSPRPKASSKSIRAQAPALSFDPWVEAPILLCLLLGPWFAAFDEEMAGRWLDAGLGVSWLITGVLALAGARRLSLTRSRQPLLLAGWLLFVMLSTVLTVDWGYSVIESTRILAAAAAFMVPLTARPVDRAQVATRMAAAMVAAGVIAASVGMTQWLRNVRLFGATDWRTFGTFSNPNALAGYLSLTTPMAAALALMARERSLKLLGWFATGLMAATVPLTQSRAGVAAFALGAFIFAMLALPGSPGRRLGIAGGGLAAAVVGLLAIPSLRERVLSTFTVNHSLMFRLHCWKAALAASLDRPLLGWGPGTYPVAHAQVAEVGPTLHAHHDLLHISTESGIPAALLLLLAVAWGIREALRVARNVEFRATGFLVSAVAAGLVAVLAHGLLESDLTIRPTLIAVMAMLAVVQLAGAQADEVSSAKAQRIGASVAACFGLLVLVASVATAVSSIHLRAARASESAGMRSVATKSYDRASVWYPLDSTPLRRRIRMSPPPLADLEAAYAPALRWNHRRAVAPESLGDSLVVAGAIAQSKPYYSKAVSLAPNRTTAILGAATALASEGNDPSELMKGLLGLRRSVYARHRAVPEMLSLEFVYVDAFYAELAGPGELSFEHGLAEVEKYLSSYEDIEAKLNKQYDRNRALVSMSLSTRGLRPSTVLQARMMHARLLWMQAEATEDRTEKQSLRNAAADADNAAVQRMDLGEWQGILLETATLRAQGGL